jgi:hypothetical protein
MGLDISVGGRNYYSHSYSALHELRLFAAQKEFPDIADQDSMYKIASKYKRFQVLINHSDCEYGYAFRHRKGESKWEWPSPKTLLKELNSLGQYKNEMSPGMLTMYKELLGAALESVKTGKRIEFH